MANPHKGEVSFEALGKTFTLKLGTNARALVEERLGAPWRVLMRRPQDEWRERDAIVLMWAGLHQFHKMTEEEVGDLIDEIGADEVASLLLKAFGHSEVKGAPDGKRGPRNRAR